MEKLFDRLIFNNTDYPSINANNLNIITKAIDDIDNRLVAVANNMADLAGLRNMLDLAEYVEKSNITLSTSGTKTVTFTDSRITAKVACQLWTSIEDIEYNSIQATNGSCTVVFSRVPTATTITARIYFK